MQITKEAKPGVAPGSRKRPRSELDELEALVDHVIFHFRIHYGIENPGQVRRTSTPGYWEVVGGCPGGENCKHAYRGVLGSCDGDQLTLYFAEHNPIARDENGRFASPYRAWYAWGEIYHQPI